jgi:hypothetical protein
VSQGGRQSCAAHQPPDPRLQVEMSVFASTRANARLRRTSLSHLALVGGEGPRVVAVCEGHLAVGSDRRDQSRKTYSTSHGPGGTRSRTGRPPMRPAPGSGLSPASTASAVSAGPPQSAQGLRSQRRASRTRIAAWTPSSARTRAPMRSARSARWRSVTACRIAQARPAAVSTDGVRPRGPERLVGDERADHLRAPGGERCTGGAAAAVVHDGCRSGRRCSTCGGGRRWIWHRYRPHRGLAPRGDDPADRARGARLGPGGLVTGAGVRCRRRSPCPRRPRPGLAAH